jgi:arsenite methyltransferase
MYAATNEKSESVEFAGQRSSNYRDALSYYPEAWFADIACMKRFLKPSAGERILEVGAGNGYFSGAIAQCLGKEGLLVASDPSVDQLSGLDQKGGFANIQVVPASADTLEIDFTDFDAI